VVYLRSPRNQRKFRCAVVVVVKMGLTERLLTDAE